MDANCLTVVKEESSSSDKFWLLESLKRRRTDYVSPDGDGYDLAPVQEREVSKKTYLNSPDTLETAKKWGIAPVIERRVHGRRINDEVELFEMEDGKETAGLRKELESEGLIVRSYVPSASKKKFPKPSFKPGKTNLDLCKETLKNAISLHEIETSRPTRFALLADASTSKAARKKYMLVCILQEKQFNEFFELRHKDYTASGVKYPVVGNYHDCEVYLHGDDSDEFTSFFRLDSKPAVEIKWYDDAALIEAGQKEAEKKARKEAKKLRQRQQMVASSSDSNAFNVLKQDEDDGEDAEAKAEAKRAKDRAKRKAQQDRKKVAKQKEEAEANVDGLNQSIADGTHFLLIQYPRNNSADAIPRIFDRVTEADSDESSDAGFGDGTVHATAEASGKQVIRMDEGKTVADMAKAVFEAGGPHAVAYAPPVEEGNMDGKIRMVEL